MSALHASLMGSFFDIADVAPIPGLTMLSVGRAAISTMTSPYLLVTPNDRDKRECLYSFHFKIKMISKAMEDTSPQVSANVDASCQPNSLALVFFVKALTGTFAVVYPQSLLRTLQPHPFSHIRLFGARSVCTVLPKAVQRAPHFNFSAIETPSVRPSAENFHLFNNLPPELRVMIWREALTNKGSTRVIQIWHDRRAKKIISDARVPAVLQVCHESRCIGLLEYQHVFNIGPLPGGVYANLKHDWIYLCASPNGRGESDDQTSLCLRRFLDAVAEEEREAIQNLAIDFIGHDQLSARNVRRLKSLKQIAMVALAPDCLGHILDGLPLGNQSIEDIWYKHYKYVQDSLKLVFREWFLFHRSSNGKWQPPFVMQLYLHTLWHVNTTRMRGFIPVYHT